VGRSYGAGGEEIASIVVVKATRWSPSCANPNNASRTI
jgi:hypothetical protein